MALLCFVGSPGGRSWRLAGQWERDEMVIQVVPDEHDKIDDDDTNKKYKGGASPEALWFAFSAQS